MTDRELLEFAAKAAGIAGFYRDGAFPGIVEPVIGGGDVPWNPLHNDGQALRLAVDLRMLVGLDGAAYALVNDQRVFAEEKGEPDAHKATRLAIVKTAAEMGKIIEATEAKHP
ncbi:hypothetical protein [Acidovorax sp.]|uniref:hypothetical protein n=1 Tax=Acidovorax sp. TaxID=1872122 RepID=UPI0031CFE1FF